MKCPHCGSFRVRQLPSQPILDEGFDFWCRACRRDIHVPAYSRMKPHIKLEGGMWFVSTGPMRGGCGPSLQSAWDEFEMLRGM